jgi:RNA polymerase sigma-70 factor (ECF subfamily)
MIGMNKEGIPTSEILNDDEIIARILHGEKDLYSIIVRRYNQRLYRVGMSMINDDAEVEDAMQVAYINAYENLGKFAFRSSFPTWLTRILINECLLRLRKEKNPSV